MDNLEAGGYAAHGEDLVVRLLAAILLELRELRAEQQAAKEAPYE